MSQPVAGVANSLRAEGEEGDRVTYVELFFDLVFAFAITQISGVLGDHPSLLSLLQAAVITLALWWVWVYTAWATNWLNPDRRLVLWLLLVLTVLGLLLSEAIPAAFGDRAVVFVTAYIVYGFIRTLGVIVATRRAAPVIAGGQVRILSWSAAASVLWIAGVFLHDPWHRLAVWAIAIVIEYTGPAVLFWIPGRGRSSWDAWQIRGGHFSERSALFIIIVLGESILVTGRGLTLHEPNVSVVVAALSAFVAAVAMWFLYFAHGQDRGRQFIAGRGTSGPVARISYTYLHVLLVIGLVLSTHGAELAIENPEGRADVIELTLIFVGTIVYLAGLLAFKVSIGVRAGWIPSHVGGMVALVSVYALGVCHLIDLDRLVAALLTSGVLVLVVVGDEVLWNHRARREPTVPDQAVSERP